MIFFIFIFSFSSFLCLFPFLCFFTLYGILSLSHILCFIYKIFDHGRPFLMQLINVSCDWKSRLLWILYTRMVCDFQITLVWVTRVWRPTCLTNLTHDLPLLKMGKLWLVLRACITHSLHLTKWKSNLKKKEQSIQDVVNTLVYICHDQTFYWRSKTIQT